MNALEWRAVVSLGAVYALRMLGMFMILPVFALYAGTLQTPAQGWQIGLAIGVYGLTQALLQIPLGMASDRWGRKPVIVLGMLVFAAGSLVAGLADTIGWIIAGRALQGAGAVSAAVAALLADSTRDSVRTMAMAILGAGMGLAFVLALVLGPVVSGWIGVDGIFLMTALLALLSLPLVLFAVPTPPVTREVEGRLADVLADANLMRLNTGIFLLHACMTALFTTAPLAVAATLGLAAETHWKLYLPVLLLSLIPVFPLIRWASDQPARGALLFRGAVVVLTAALTLAAFGHARPALLVAALLLFFVGFNYLEGALPSLISRAAPPRQKGAALGIYASSQFLGAFAGGALGGMALQHGGIGATFALAAGLAAVWLLLVLRRAPEVPALRGEASGDGARS
ncbi:MAG TPA: MFS transporter [Solimonas sp.]